MNDAICETLATWVYQLDPMLKDQVDNDAMIALARGLGYDQWSSIDIYDAACLLLVVYVANGVSVEDATRISLDAVSEFMVDQ